MLPLGGEPGRPSGPREGRVEGFEPSPLPEVEQGIEALRAKQWHRGPGPRGGQLDHVRALDEPGDPGVVGAGEDHDAGLREIGDHIPCDRGRERHVADPGRLHEPDSAWAGIEVPLAAERSEGSEEANADRRVESPQQRVAASTRRRLRASCRE